MKFSTTISAVGGSHAADRIVAVVIIVLAVVAISVSRHFPHTGIDTDVGSARFPLVYSGALIILGLLLMSKTFFGRSEVAAKSQKEVAEGINDTTQTTVANDVSLNVFYPLPVIIGAAATGIYIFAISLLGYIPTTIVFLIGMMGLMGMRHKLWNPVIALAITAFLYLVFVYGLNVPLPEASLFETPELM